jgi:hypothetical protein
MKATTRSKLLVMVTLSAGLWCGSAWADVARITAEVTRTLVQPDGTYGACMAALSVSPTSALPSCAPDWVTFSCTGDFGDAVGAWRQFDQAQLALAGDSRVLASISTVLGSANTRTGCL